MSLDNIYVNGSQIGSTGTGCGDFSATSPVRIGLAVGTYYPFKGIIDEVKIYSRALTAAEVSMNYQEGLDRLALRGRWSFEEAGANIITHNGAITCPPDLNIHGAAWTNGMAGNALHFAGTSDYVDCGAGGELNITNAITMEAWIKPEKILSFYGGIIGRNAYGKRMLLSSGGNILVQMDGPQQATTTTPITTNQWNYVVYTSDGSNSTIYVNGAAVSTGNCGANFSSTASVRIGLAVGTNYPFKGIIDEVGLFARVLTPAEISARYNAKVLCGQWHFNEGTDTIAFDTSGNYNHSVIYGATWTYQNPDYALSFDGNDYVDCGAGSSLNISDAITMEAWIKPQALSSSYGQIVGRATWAYGKRMLLSASGNILVQMDGPQQMTTTSPVTTNQWNHVVYTSGGSNSAIYVNAAAVSFGNCGADFRSTSPVYIGIGVASNYPFNGMIDEVNIYRKVFSASEVSARYQAGRY